MVYMADDNQDIKKNSKGKKTILNIFEGLLFPLAYFLFGIFGGIILTIPIAIIIELAKKNGDKKDEITVVILTYVFVILLFIWVEFYLSSIYTSYISTLVSTGAQNP
jgi:glycopeptide antibiotics resistance protein